MFVRASKFSTLLFLFKAKPSKHFQFTLKNQFIAYTMNAVSKLNNRDKKKDEISIINERYTNIVSRMSMGMRRVITVLLEHT
jgi:hypothetical protein